jgi:hypothetical protein
LISEALELVKVPTGASCLTEAKPLARDSKTQNGRLSPVYFDLLDREIARDTQGFDGSTVRAARQYDALGRVSQTSRPYFAPTAARACLVALISVSSSMVWRHPRTRPSGDPSRPSPSDGSNRSARAVFFSQRDSHGRDARMDGL